jgi:hypothetical protein
VVGVVWTVLFEVLLKLGVGSEAEALSAGETTSEVDTSWVTLVRTGEPTLLDVEVSLLTATVKVRLLMVDVEVTLLTV